MSSGFGNCSSGNDRWQRPHRGGSMRRKRVPLGNAKGAPSSARTLTVEFSQITPMSVTNNQSRFRNWLAILFALPTPSRMAFVSDPSVLLAVKLLQLAQ